MASDGRGLRVKVWIDRISMAGNPIAEYNLDHIHVRGAESGQLVLVEIVDTGNPVVAKPMETICGFDPEKTWSLTGPNHIGEYDYRADNEAPDVVQAANRLDRLVKRQDDTDIIGRILEKVEPQSAEEINQVGELAKLVKRVNKNGKNSLTATVVSFIKNQTIRLRLNEMPEIAILNPYKERSSAEIFLRIAHLVAVEEFYLAKKLTSEFVSENGDGSRPKYEEKEISDESETDRWTRLLSKASQNGIREFRETATEYLQGITDNMSNEDEPIPILHKAAKKSSLKQDSGGQGKPESEKEYYDNQNISSDELDVFIAETASLIGMNVPELRNLEVCHDPKQSENNKAVTTNSDSTISPNATSSSGPNKTDDVAGSEQGTGIKKVNRKAVKELGDYSRIFTSAIDSDHTLNQLRKQAEQEAREQVKPREATSTTNKTQRYARSEAIKRYAKARANGFCESCEKPAPFKNSQGEPYLHAHHVYELSEGGKDTPETVIALCPNCHYRVHHGIDGEQFNRKLIEKLERIEEILVENQE